MSKLHIYAQASTSGFNASSYYRIVLPLWTMHKLGLPVQIDLDSYSADCQWEARYNRMMSTDINMSYQVCSPEFLDLIRRSRKWPYQKNPEGGRIAPPTFTADTDDDLFNVHPLNIAYKNLGYKDHEGNELKRGDKIWKRHPVTNEPELMWADGENIDFATNKAQLDVWREMMREAELITTSTNGTKKMIMREIGEEAESKIFINPNCIDLSEYPKIDLAPSNEIKILWQGSPTHWEDWWAIKDQLGNVARKYPNAKFIVWGVDYKWLLDCIPTEQLEVIPWMDYRVFKLRASTIGHDIALAPLKPTIFNQCRSAIKWYEAAAVWKPAACLAQKTAVFAEEIEEGVTGSLFETPEEFETKLCELIEDEKKRKELASNAKDWIRTHRDPSNHAIKLFEQLQKTRAARLEWPEPKNELTKTKHTNVRSRKGKGVRKRKPR